MGDTLIPKQEPAKDPASDQLGGGLYYCLRVPISTSISEGGLGHCAGFHLDVAETFIDRYNLGLEFNYTGTEGKLFPSTDSAGTTYDRTHWALQFAFGRTRRLYPFFSDAGDHTASLSLNTTPMIGGGSTTLSRSPVTLEGDQYGFGEQREKTWDLSTTYSLPLDITLKDRWGMRLAPSLRYGVQYAGSGSEANRVNLDFMFTASIFLGDASTQPGGDADTEMGPMGIAQGLFAMGHGWAQRYMMARTLSAPQEALETYGILQPQSGGSRGSMSDVPKLEAGAAFLGAADSSLTPALRAGEGWYWGLLGIQTLGEGLSFIDDSTAMRTGALSGLLKTPRLLGYAIAGIETPGKRLMLTNEIVELREMYINLVSYALNTVVMFGGALGGSDWVGQAGVGANLGVAFTPDPSERGTVERTDYTFVPVAISGGSQSGLRQGIVIHKSWHDVPMPELQLFSSVMLLSPLLYGDAPQTSDIDAALGLEWKTTYTRLLFGVDTKAVHGGGPDWKTGFGGLVGFDVLIPFNGQESGTGLTLGARFMAHKLFPDGYSYTFLPTIGLTLGK